MPGPSTAPVWPLLRGMVTLVESIRSARARCVVGGALREGVRGRKRRRRTGADRPRAGLSTLAMVRGCRCWPGHAPDGEEADGEEAPLPWTTWPEKGGGWLAALPWSSPSSSRGLAAGGRRGHQQALLRPVAAGDVALFQMFTGMAKLIIVAGPMLIRRIPGCVACSVPRRRAQDDFHYEANEPWKWPTRAPRRPCTRAAAHFLSWWRCSIVVFQSGPAAPRRPARRRHPPGGRIGQKSSSSCSSCRSCRSSRGDLRDPAHLRALLHDRPARACSGRLPGQNSPPPSGRRPARGGAGLAARHPVARGGAGAPAQHRSGLRRLRPCPPRPGYARNAGSPVSLVCSQPDADHQRRHWRISSRVMSPWFS